MTAVVSDTSPINYLCVIEAIHALPALFSEVLIPPAVLSELGHPRTPKAVAEWLQTQPSWIRVQAPITLRHGLNLDAGEAEAISLALELHVPSILIDEASGRAAASAHGLQIFGTLAVLVSADAQGLLDLETSLIRLRATNFHVHPTLIDALIRDARARKGR